MNTYHTRKVVNERSRGDAENYQEIWDETSVEYLEEHWSIDRLEELAVRLGRTVEACRQKHYDLNRVRPAARRAAATLTKWTRGFTSIDEMGY